MPYNPALPADHSPVVSAEMRGQLAGLNDRINAIPAGPQGPQGVAGPPFANAIVDGVATLNPGDNAAVGVSFDGANVHFNFGIPRGNDGGQGMQGPQGGVGPPGEVTALQLADGITAALATAAAAAAANSSANSNGVATLDMPFADPDVEALRLKVSELISAMRR